MTNSSKSTIKSTLVAPCGMNCALCMAHLMRKKDVCPGCRGEDKFKPKYCVSCKIVNCPHFKDGKSRFCFDCKKFPCTRLKQLDKRYRTKYGMSMIENLKKIEEVGIREFVKNERARWACLKCGGVLCVHREACPSCGDIRKIERLDK